MKKTARCEKAQVIRIENADMFNTATLVPNRMERGTMPLGFQGAVGLWKVVFLLSDGSEHEIIMKSRKSRKFSVGEKGTLTICEGNRFKWSPEVQNE